MLLRFLASVSLLLSFTPEAASQIVGGGINVDATQIATSFESGLNRCTGQLATRRCCTFSFTVRNTTPNPITTFWLEVEAGNGAVMCYDHGAPFGTNDISLPGCLPTMCYAWDCAGYTTANGSNRGVIRFDCLLPIAPGTQRTGKFKVDTSTVNAGPLGTSVAHGVQSGCVHVHATSNSPASLGTACGTGNFSAHQNNLMAQFWSQGNNWCCCESSPVNYCTAGKSTSGCQAMISATGTSSATASNGFLLKAGNVEGSNAGVSGLFYYGVNGRQANPWGNPAMNCTSFQCVTPPTLRGALLNGGGSNGNCDGSFVYDLNARWTQKPSHNPGAGATVQAQLWYRDPQNPCQGAMAQSTTALSNAIEWNVCP
jgi:hypothetical protein